MTNAFSPPNELKYECLTIKRLWAASRDTIITLHFIDIVSIMTTTTMMKKENVTSSSSFYAMAGDTFHWISIASTVAFALMAGKYMRDPTSTFFDSQWKQEGFCVTNRDIPYWNSHDMCLYVDTALALLAGLLFLAWRKDPGMESANVIFQSGIPGVLLHGFGHGALGKAIREGTMSLEEGHKLVIETTMEKSESALHFAVSLLPLIAFWYFLSRASMPQLSNVYVVLAAGLAVLRQLWTPNDFGFTYVQTVLMLEFSINQLARPKEEKDLGYCLYPAIVGLPLTLVGWMESTMCSTMVRDFLYGHLAYDAYIPIAMMTWYATIHSQVTAPSADKAKRL